MKLQWVFSTLGCPRLSLEESVALARRFSFAGVELRALNGRIDLAQALQDAYQTPTAFARKAAELAIPVVAIDTSWRLFGGSHAQRAEALALCRWADVLNIPFIRVFDGGTDGQAADPAVRAAMVHELDEWQLLREDYGIRCRPMIETHWSLTNAEDILRLADECGGEIDLLWDILHTWRRDGRSPLKDWPQLKPFVRHIHIKDAVLDPTHKNGARHTLPGQGCIPVAELLQALQGDGFALPVSLEWESYWNPDAPSLEEALDSGRAASWW